MHEQLPAILPKFKVQDMEEPYFESGLGRKKRFVREKRFITNLISLGFQGISALLNHRKQNKLQKEMKYLLMRQEALNNKIMALEDDMMALTKATLSELHYLRKELESTIMWIKHLTKKIKILLLEIYRNSARIADNSNAIVFLSGTISILLSEMERYLALYQQTISELDHLLDTLDNLSNNLLSHSVIAPNVLKNLLDHVKEQLSEKYPDYELVIDEVHQYYNLPLISFDYQEGILGIQIPLFIKQRLQEPLVLFNIKSIPVPFHVNDVLVDENESKYTYNQVPTTTEILAMSSDTNINLDYKELSQCIKFLILDFCEQLFLMKHTSEHTCESPIYHNESPNIIKDKCNIQYYPDLNPEPAILDAGNYLLLGNLPLPWTIICNHNDQIPNPIQGSSYAIVDKSDLCQCSISAGTWYIQENIVYCTDKMDTKIDLHYTVNMAVMIYQFEDKISKGKVTDITLYREPIKYDSLEPIIVLEEEDEILGQDCPAVSLKETMENILYKRFATKQDYALAMNNPTNWFNGDNKWYGFMAIGTILAVLFTPVVIFVLVKFFGFKFQFDKTSATITKLLTMVKVIPPVKAEWYLDVSDWQILEMIFKIVLFSVLIYVSYKFVKFVMSYVNMDNLAEIQSNFSFPTTLLLDKTDLYLQFVNTGSIVNVSIKVGSIFGYSEDLSVGGSLQRKSFTLDKQFMYDFLEINWGNCKINLNNLDLQLSHVCQIPLITKFFLRKLFQNHKTMYRLIACQTTSRKVMVILPLCDLYDYGTEVNVISELTSASEEEVIEEGVEDISTEQTYATVNGIEMSGMSELEVNELMTN